MFKSKINGMLIEEYRTPSQLTRGLIKNLKKKRRNSKIAYAILTFCLFLVNVATIVLAAIALDYSLENNIQIFTTGLVAGLIILSFLLSLIISIYQGIMKAKVYKEIFELIQEETLEYYEAQNQYQKQNQSLFLKNIHKIIKKEKLKRNNVNFLKALINILTGGDDE